MLQAPGWATARFDARGLVARRTEGVTDLASLAPVERTTRFRWFSVTKLVTTLTTLRLVERGALSLESDVRAHLPWFRPGCAVRVRHLLSHSSGLADPSALGWVHPAGGARRSDAELTRETFARHRRLRSYPGSVATYTNLGFLVLGELVASLEGSYEAAALRVLRDAGAQTASFERGELARGHERMRSLRTLVMAGLFAPRTPDLVAYLKHGWVGLSELELEGRAYGGLMGSIDDLVALGRALLVPGVVVDGALLDAMRRRHATGSRGAYGLGFWFHRDGWIGHGGEAGGYRAELHLDPRRELGCAVLVNAGQALTGALVEHLKEA